MSEQEIRQELERLRRENEELKARAGKSVYLKVSAKGGVSVYGLRRFPITFYRDEWLRLLDMGDTIRAFMVEHDGELSSKD